MKWRRIAAVTVKETKDITRGPITVAVALLMPLVMLLLFGYAISLDIDDAAFGVLDLDRTPQSRALIDRFESSGSFRLVGEYQSEHEVERALQRNVAKLTLAIPPGFARALARGEAAPVQVLVDGTYSATANLIVGYAAAVVSAYPSAARESVIVEPRIWYNPSLSSVAFVVPGLFGVILMAFPPLLTALAITREKESGSIQQIFASPLTAPEFLAGKLIPYGVIAFVQIAMVISVGFVWFGVPLRGSLLLLFATGLVYVFCTVGIGLLVSTVTTSQLVAMLLALIVTMMPSFLFSGFLFPIFTMPYLLQLYTRIFPARYFIDLSRGIVLKGAALPELWPTILLLFAYTLIVFLLAVWRFKKKVA
ncbi:ABC transporter permease [Hyphomonas sp.]|uniref:ABC transporter permease n=2 Tax=Pseudomonadota TaxID=1224 RepID=UPI003267CB80